MARTTQAQLQRGHAEQLRKRLGAFQAAKEEEIKRLKKKLDEALDSTSSEAAERMRLERQAVDSLRRLSEASAALGYAGVGLALLPLTLRRVPLIAQLVALCPIHDRLLS